MSITFESIWPLLLLVPGIGLTVWIYSAHLRGGNGQRVFVIIRLITIVLIVLALANPMVIRHAKDVATIFVADISSSTVTEHDEIQAFITQAIKSKGEKDHVGVIAFANNAQVETSVSDQGYFDGFETSVNKNFTDIQTALIQGNAMFPAGMKKRLVVLTDGRENIGDVSRQVGTIIQNNVAVDFYDMDVATVAEVQIESVELPKQGEKNQIIEVKVVVASNVKQNASLYIYSKNQLKQEQVVELEVGDNHFVFTDTVTEGGMVAYRAQVIAQEDTFAQNNQQSSFIMINDMPKIMVIEDDEKQGQNIVSMLEGYAHIVTKNAGELPLEAAALLEYDAFIIADVSKDALDDGFLENLEAMVKNQGKGLLVTGGDNSFGLGGYKDTLLETMLPVAMEVKSKEEKPNLGLVLVIDKSGSMTSGQYGVSKMELAKEAAIRATEILEEKDQLGVLAFDGASKWVIETSLVDNKKSMQKDIATIVASGGTSILPALSAAVDDLKDRDVGLKHIILLTDGQAEREGYESTLAIMADQGITLSTVAVGEGADRYLLYYLAENGGGRYYATDVFTDIPAIFTKEAYMAGKKYLNNVSFFPEVYSSSVILSGIEGLPELDGYVATSKKDNARTVLVGPEEDPILATWQYGLGRSMAWTADMQGLWSSKWLGWEGNQHFWINSLSWLIQEGLNDAYSIDSSYEEGQGKIKVVSVEADATMTEDMTGVLVSPKGIDSPITIEAIAPGQYEGSFTPDGEGVYMVHIPLENGETLATGVNVGYSPEFDILGHDMTTPKSLASLSGGRLLLDPQKVFEGELPDVKGRYELEKVLLIIALLLFVCEIILRKTNLNFEWVTKASESVKLAKDDLLAKDIRKSKSGKRYDTSKVAGGDPYGRDGVSEGNDVDVSPGSGYGSLGQKKSKKNHKRKAKKRAQVDLSHIDALMKQKGNRNK